MTSPEKSENGHQYRPWSNQMNWVVLMLGATLILFAIFLVMRGTAAQLAVVKPLLYAGVGLILIAVTGVLPQGLLP